MTLFEAPALKKKWQTFVFPQMVVWALILGLGCTFTTAVKANRNAENFKITTKTFEKLQQENFPQTLLKALTPFLNELHPSKEAFLKALKSIQNPPFQNDQIDLVVKHALLNNLWIDSDKAEADLKTGESVLTGNVKGGIPKENITFAADRVRIVTEGPQRLNKIVAESNVRIQQLGRTMTTDRAIYNRATQIMDLIGHIVIKDEGVTLYGTTANLNRLEEKIEVRGHGNSSQQDNSNQRVRVEYAPQIIENTENSPDAQPSVIQAQSAILENKKQQATFEGKVEMTRPQRQLYLRGGKILLFFNDKRELVSSNAEQQVCIEQPGRAARADRAEVDEPTQTILLEGNAEISRGGAYLAGPTINLFFDVEKGEAKGDSNTRVQMVIPLDEDNPQQTTTPQRFTCR